MTIQTKALLKGFIKTTGAVAIIVAIASVILTAKSPHELNIAEADADISWGSLMPQRSNQQRFVTTLMEEGFAKPRSYDWNGNKFFFSMMETSESPAEVTARLQNGFVRNKINKKKYLTAAQPVPVEGTNIKPDQIPSSMKSFEQWEEFFTGGIIPLDVTTNSITMSGSQTKNNAKNAAEMLINVTENKGLEKSIKSMRFIEASKPEGSTKTTVTATWSDENLSFDKWQQRGEGLDFSVDAAIPACIGCERDMRFAGEDKESGYKQTVFSGHNTVEATNRFYNQALGNRGWQPTESAAVMDELREKGLIPYGGPEITNYARGKEFISVLVYPDQETGRAVTHIVESP